MKKDCWIIGCEEYALYNLPMGNYQKQKVCKKHNKQLLKLKIYIENLRMNKIKACIKKAEKDIETINERPKKVE